MNRFHMIPAGLLSLGLFATISAQDVQPKTPGQPDAPAAAAPGAAVTAPAPTYSEQQVLEAFGWFVGKRIGLAELGFSNEQVESMVKGMLVSAAGKEAPYDLEKIGPQMEAYMQKKQEAYLSKVRNQSLGEAKAFFEKLKENKNVLETPSGLRYEIVQPGTGVYPTPTDTVKVHYTGKLINGTVFDSSIQRNEPAEFQLKGVIPGWTEGLQKINQGGKIRLYVPPQLAYGDNPQQGIPPGSTLIFDVELLEVKATPPAPVAPAPVAPAPVAPAPEAPKS
jgi:FKBP-type peptidyl-prolyl cis-trans isomerase